MKNKLKLIITISILLMLIIPVNAITEYITYDTGYVSGHEEMTYGVGDLTIPYDTNIQIIFPDVQKWKQTKSIIYYFDVVAHMGWGIRDLTEHTSEVPVTYRIGGNIVSTGILQFVRHTDSLGALSGGILTYIFDTPLDTTLTGSQTVVCDYTLLDFNFKTYKPRYGVATTGSDDCPYPWFSGTGGSGNHQYLEGNAYRRGEFNLDFTYDYENNAKQSLNLTVNRNSVVSFIRMWDKTELLALSDTSNDDISLNNLYGIPYNLSIKNPVYTGSGSGEYFNYTIPTDVVDTNTANLVYRVHNGEEPTKIISTSYNLNILNETSELYELYTSGFNPGIMDLDLPNNRYYNMSLTRYQFTPKDHLFTLSGDTDLTAYMYPDYAGNYTVTFKLREHITGIILEGAKVIAGGITKYTGYDGSVGFGDIDGVINYEISKTGYVPISGNKTITSNQAIFIYLITEEQAIEPTTTPTITPPDIDQPTNIMESIQFAFQKMFGLSSSSEDMEISNLFMGLLIIFGGACLIAGITKDALGAVIGALIGFVMSLALGFIPLWVLFVGFASFAIYIILTKTGGTE